MAAETDTGSIEGFGQVSRTVGTVFRYLLLAATMFGIVMLAVLLLYVANDAIRPLTADPGWYLAFFLALVVPTALAGWTVRRRDPAALTFGAFLVGTLVVSLMFSGGVALLVIDVVPPLVALAFAIGLLVPLAATIGLTRYAHRIPFTTRLAATTAVFYLSLFGLPGPIGDAVGAPRVLPSLVAFVQSIPVIPVDWMMVTAVVGGASTNVHISASEQVFIPNGMCACSPSATAVTISQIEDDDLLFRTTPSDALQGEVMAQYATNQLDAGTAAVLHVNDDYGSALSGAFVSAFENAGGSVQQEVSYETSATSYTSRIQSALQDDPDMLAVVGYAESGIQLFRDYYAQFSADRDIMTVDGLNTARVPNEVGEPMDNVVGTAPLVQGPGQDTFASLYQDAFDSEPGPFNAQTFDAAAVLMLANASAGENDGAAISEEMRSVANEGEMTVSPENLAAGVDAAAEGEDVVYQGASSQVTFDDNGDLATGAYEIWKYAPDTERGIETVEEFVIE